jgi:hypothetical protein
MPKKSKKQTHKDKPKVMLKEEKTIVDLELAVTKEKFRKEKKKKKGLKVDSV